MVLWKWGFRHREHGASTPAGTPTRQQGWNVAGQRPGQDYSLRAVSHSPQTTGCVITAAESWITHVIARPSERSMLGLSTQLSCLTARAAHRGAAGEPEHGTRAGLFLFTCQFLPFSKSADLEGSCGTKPTESYSALGGAQGIPAAHWSCSHS